MTYNRGDIFTCDLGFQNGSVQGGLRPVIVLQNDTGNRYSPTVIVSPVTSQCKTKLPTHVPLKDCGLYDNSIALLEQIHTVDKMQLRKKIGTINADVLNDAIKISLGV